MLSKVKTRSPYHTNLQQISFLASNYSSRTQYKCKRKCLCFKMYLTSIANLPPFSWRCNVMNDMLKGKYQDKKLTEFYKCLLSEEYTKNHMLGNWYQYFTIPICVKKHFKRWSTQTYVTGLIPSRGVHKATNWCFSNSLSLPLPPLSKINIHILG